MNFRRGVDERVALVRDWLVTGDFAGSEAAVARESSRSAERHPAGRDEAELTPSSRGGGHHDRPGARREAAYTAAPVVVAVNEEFLFNGYPVHRKVTVCQARPVWSTSRASWRRSARSRMVGAVAPPSAGRRRASLRSSRPTRSSRSWRSTCSGYDRPAGEAAKGFRDRIHQSSGEYPEIQYLLVVRPSPLPGADQVGRKVR